MGKVEARALFQTIWDFFYDLGIYKRVYIAFTISQTIEIGSIFSFTILCSSQLSQRSTASWKHVASWFVRVPFYSAMLALLLESSKVAGVSSFQLLTPTSYSLANKGYYFCTSR